MDILRLDLEQFRRYARAEIAIPREGLAIYGRNASGKSTLLEAVASLSTTRSPRTANDREMIRWESGTEYGLPPFARIAARVERIDGQIDVEIGMGIDRESVKKQYKLNGRSVRATTLVGQLRSVLFTPEDVGLITGPPSERRRYLDLALCQLDVGYMRALSAYTRTLGQRNALLKRFNRDGVNPRDPGVATELRYWDDQLVQHGAIVLSRRFDLVGALDRHASREYVRLDGGRLAIAYAPSLVGFEPSGHNELPVDAAALALHESLESRRIDEVRRGVTLSGPHRDDLSIEIDGHAAGPFASRGQQRLAVLALKLGEAAVMAETGGDAPIVMLDDILSELDERHRGLVLETAVALESQLLITSTDRALLDAPIVRDLERRETRDGTLLPGDS